MCKNFKFWCTNFQKSPYCGRGDTPSHTIPPARSLHSLALAPLLKILAMSLLFQVSCERKTGWRKSWSKSQIFTTNATSDNLPRHLTVWISPKQRPQNSLGSSFGKKAFNMLFLSAQHMFCSNQELCEYSFIFQTLQNFMYTMLSDR